MRKVVFFSLITQAVALVCPAVNVVPGDSTGISLSGSSYSFSRIRWSSATGETNADATVYGNNLKFSFSGGSYLSTTNGAGLNFDFATGNFGVVIQSFSPTSAIDDLFITASGGYSLYSDPASVNSFAEVVAQIPFNFQVVGVNGAAYSSAQLVRGFSLQVAPSQSFYVPTGGMRIDRGSWTATWSVQGLGTSLAEIFNLPTMKITALDLAITPDLTAVAQNGTASIYLNFLDITPVPEPSTFSLLTAGGAWLLLSRRRKT